MKFLYLKKIRQFNLWAAVVVALFGLIPFAALGTDADIQVQIAVVSTSFSNQPVVLKIYTTNNGPSGATGVTVNNKLPGNLVLDSYSTSSGTYDTTTHTWIIGSIESGQMDTLRLVAYPRSSGNYIVSAYKSAENENDSIPANDSSSAEFTIFPSCDLVVIAETENGVFEQNSVVTMDVYALNEGPNNATNVKVFNPLPPGLTYYNDSLGSGTYDTITGIWNIGTMYASSFATMKLRVRVNSGDSATKDEQGHITYMGATPYANTNLISNFNIPAFPDTLGNLVSVRFTKYDTISNLVKIENMDPNHTCNYNCKANGHFKLSGPDGFLFSTSTNDILDSITLGKYDGTLNYGGSSGYNFGNKITSATNSNTVTTNLFRYKSSDSVSQLNFIDSLDSSFTIKTLYSNNVSQVISTLVRSTVMVNYYYMPNSSAYHINNPFTIGGDQFDPDVSNNTSIAQINSLDPLPVELVNLQAIPLLSKVQVKWSTASEINNNHFDVERSGNSGDNLAFEQIGEVAGNDNSVVLQNYNFMDLAPLNGISFYRLKQVDNNGNFTYSNIVEVSLGQNASAFTPAMSIYPNPVVKGDNSFISLTGFPSGNASVQIFDITGKVIYQQDITIDNNMPFMSRIPTSNSLSNGIYTILVNDGNNTYSGKWVVLGN